MGEGPRPRRRAWWGRGPRRVRSQSEGALPLHPLLGQPTSCCGATFSFISPDPLPGRRSSSRRRRDAQVQLPEAPGSRPKLREFPARRGAGQGDRSRVPADHLQPKVQVQVRAGPRPGPESRAPFAATTPALGPPCPPERGAGGRGTQFPRQLRGSWGGADIPSRGAHAPSTRPAPAEPLRPRPAKSLPRIPRPRLPGPGRGRAGGQPPLRGARGTAPGGGGARGVGVWASRTRGEAASWWRRAPARAAWHPRPLVEGLLQVPLHHPTPAPSWCRRENLREFGRRKGTNYIGTEPPLAPVAPPWRPRPGPSPGDPSILWLKAVRSPSLLPSKWKSKRLHSVQP